MRCDDGTCLPDVVVVVRGWARRSSTVGGKRGSGKLHLTSPVLGHMEDKNKRFELDMAMITLLEGEMAAVHGEMMYF